MKGTTNKSSDCTHLEFPQVNQCLVHLVVARTDDCDGNREHEDAIIRRQHLGGVNSRRQLRGIDFNFEGTTIVHQNEVIWSLYPWFSYFEVKLHFELYAPTLSFSGDVVFSETRIDGHCKRFTYG